MDSQAAVSFSPGEVIFFGEHSVVYGKTAIAAAISRGVEARGVSVEGRIEISSHLGRLRADLEGNRFTHVEADEYLEPLQYIFSRLFSRLGKSIGMKITISSTIPEQSGLASSAAVSSALISLVLSFLGQKLSVTELVDLVYESELRIQRRGSIIGSSTTVNGGFVCVKEGRWSRLRIKPNGLRILVIDTKERCPTSVTTAKVKALLDKDPTGTRSLFDEMDKVAQEGISSLEGGKWAEVGRFMNQNQECLRRLGVSTPKIDALTQRIKDWAFGSKITGAGGGGCLICLPKEGAEKKLAEVVGQFDSLILETELRQEGVQCLREEVVCKP